MHQPSVLHITWKTIKHISTLPLSLSPTNSTSPKVSLTSSKSSPRLYFANIPRRITLSAAKIQQRPVCFWSVTLHSCLAPTYRTAATAVEARKRRKCLGAAHAENVVDASQGIYPTTTSADIILSSWRQNERYRKTFAKSPATYLRDLDAIVVVVADAHVPPHEDIPHVRPGDCIPAGIMIAAASVAGLRCGRGAV